MKNYFLLLTVLMPLVIASKCTEDSLSKIPTKDFIIDFDGVQVEETLKFLDDAEGNRDRLYVSNNNKTSSSDKSFTSISISAYQDYDSAEVTLQTYKSIYTSDYYCTRAGEMESCYTRAELSSTDVLSRIILAQKDEMSATYLSSIGNAVEYQVQWSNDEYTEINGQATWFRGVNIYEFYSSLSSSGVFSFYLVLPETNFTLITIEEDFSVLTGEDEDYTYELLKGEQGDLLRLTLLMLERARSLDLDLEYDLL